MRTVRVDLDTNSYRINIGAGILSHAGVWLRELGFGGKLVVITNPTIASHYGETIEQGLVGAGFKVTTLEVPDGEEQKSLETAGQLYLQLADCMAERNTPILALGGGVIGDLAGFVAATYLRGVPFIQVPTTLLAQVDSSMGGKVAVNHGRLKNSVGTFYQPRLVISDVTTLKTLKPNILNDGLAEVIKYGVIRDRDFFSYLENNMTDIKLLNAGALEMIISSSAEIKAEVVVEDEHDLGIRAILNYGHTAGHAIETVSDFGVSHGEAVAIGMVVAADIAVTIGALASEERERLVRLLEVTGLPTRLPDFDIEGLLSIMQYDKKVKNGKVRFVLPRSLGEVFVTDEIALSLVKKVLISAKGNK